jgi:hypothetical protein
MFNPSESPSETDGTDTDRDADPSLAPTPVRFGRLALWIASASALTMGVMGTVAYGVWFNQDQRAYAEAMEHARQTLWLAAPVPAAEAMTAPAVQQTASSDKVAGPMAPARPVALASADLHGPVSSAQLDSRAARTDPTTSKLAVTRPVRASCSTSVERRRPAPRVKTNSNLFARMGSFFHRVSYRQHGNESQRDIYAHP